MGPDFASGCISAFTQRHRLRSRQLPGEAASADPVSVALGCQQLQYIIDLYEPINIYNMDEIRLCYAMTPARSTCTKSARGTKKDKTKITVSLTANADGSWRLFRSCEAAILIQKRLVKELGFSYRSNAKA